MENPDRPKTENKIVVSKQINYLKKKYKDYFFDFFMLFLAVTLGFFVNNLSDDRSDRQREKQYMKSLINDLISDTTQINEVHSDIKNRISGIDTLLRVLENQDQENFISSFYYFTVKYLNSATFYSGSDRTISQLKSAGGLRLIHKIAVSDSIVNYYGFSDNVRYNTDFCLAEFNKILDFEKEILYFKYLRMHNINSIRQMKDMELLINDPVKITQFYNQVISYPSLLMNYNSLISELKMEAESLLSRVKESYKL